jgi:SAM-dependent methyltransferase
MTTSVSYGAGVADDSELRLCGDVQGKRVIELGIDTESNAPALATAGARVIVVEPSADRIAAARTASADGGYRLEAHQGDLADLGFATSASVDLVLCVHRLDKVDDLARTLRQVHRVLKPNGPFVLATAHPAGGMLGPGATIGSVVERPYRDAATFTLNHLFTALQRANFSVDALQELEAGSSAAAPTVLVLRARKLGD